MNVLFFFLLTAEAVLSISNKELKLTASKLFQD